MGKFTLDDILGGVCLAVLILGMPWAMPILAMLFSG